MKTVGSMFSGIGGFDLGFERAGFRIAWCVEFDKHAQAVLRKRFPHAKIYGDIREVDALELERVDVICGGFPCQDLSVAGKRAGLAGSRSGLFHDAIRIVRAIKPAIVVLENVPGLLSSNQGHDFATVIRELGEGWPCAEVAWRVLDSQYFGVAQRRRRVFIVASAAIGHAEQVLALAESVCGNPPTRQPKGKDFAASSQGSVGASFQTAIAESEVSSTICAKIVGAIDCNIPKQRAQNAAQGHYIAVAKGGDLGGESETIVSIQGNLIGRETGGPHGVGVSVKEPMYTLTSTDVHAVAIRTANTKANGHGVAENVTHTLDGAQGQAIAHAFYSTGGTHGLETHSEISPPLKVGTTLGIPSGVAVAHTIDTHAACIALDEQLNPTVNIAGTVIRGGDGGRQAAVCISVDDPSRSPQSSEVTAQIASVIQATNGMVVRRLTPVECERLQGFPDGWTDIGTLEKPTADSHRYKQLGNAVTVNVAQWIAQKIEETLCAKP